MHPDFKTLPSLFTCLNLFFGFGAILQTAQRDFETAAWFVIIAVLCDGMDGKIARSTGTDSIYGFQMDSLADLISFGAAPAFLAYASALNSLDPAGMLIAFGYLLAGLYRLARFNVIQAGDRTQGYIGLPIPVAGMAVAAGELFQPYAVSFVYAGVYVFLLVFLSVMMISTVPYAWPVLEFHRSFYLRLKSVFILVCVTGMALFPNWCLFPVLGLYILLGLAEWIHAWMKGDVSAAEFFHVIH